MENEAAMAGRFSSPWWVKEEQQEITSTLSREKLHLLGTVHHDPKGCQKLHDFLEQQGADLILLEFSAYGLSYRKENGAHLQKQFWINLAWAAGQLGLKAKGARQHPEVDAVRRQLGLPFEYRAARRFGLRHRVPVHLVDCSSFSQRMIASWEELVSPKNLFHLLSIPSHRPPVDLLYRKAHRLIFPEGTHRPPGELPSKAPSPSGLWQKRERDLARRIENILAFHDTKKPVYVGGWQHLVPGQEFATLRELLKIEKDRCHLLTGPAETGGHEC